MDVFTVLLVDDEEEFLETLVKRLAKRKLSVTGVTSGEEAIRVLVERPVDVVVLDVKMPGMDGLETLRNIKKSHPLVEVIMLTGHATVESAIDGMKLGAFDYLMKPSDMDVLMEKLNAAKSKKSQHEQKIIEAEAQNIALRRGD